MAQDGRRERPAGDNRNGNQHSARSQARSERIELRRRRPETGQQGDGEQGQAKDKALGHAVESFRAEHLPANRYREAQSKAGRQGRRRRGTASVAGSDRAGSQHAHRGSGTSAGSIDPLANWAGQTVTLCGVAAAAAEPEAPAAIVAAIAGCHCQTTAAASSF